MLLNMELLPKIQMNSPCTISGKGLNCLYLVSMKTIPLTQGKVAIVDDEDYEELSKYNWSALRGGSGVYYARRKKDKKMLIMHRIILNAKYGEMVDHINHNGLDNRKENLRICTNSQNQMNRKRNIGVSKYKGVHWSKHSNKWRARITKNGKNAHLGLFGSEKDAARAYNKKATILFGEFALLNDI